MKRYTLHLIITLFFVLGLVFGLNSNGGADAYSKTDLLKGGGNDKIKTIVIDAGHGGHDTGCLGAKAYEKNVTLAIALKLGAYITKYFPDIKVIYTRNTDTFVELHERADIANRNNADFFISIHCNSGPPEAYGTESYVLGLHRTEANLAVAKRENSVILMEDNYQANYDGFDPNSAEAHIMLCLAQNAHIDQSILLASKVEDQFQTHFQRHSRGVKQAGFIVLYQSTMPSLLVETGFLTNPTEEKYLTSEEGQDYVASAIYRAFKEYKDQMEGIVDDIIADKDLPTPDNAVKPDSDKVVDDFSPQRDLNDPQAIVFKIQILASGDKIPLDDRQFEMFPKVEVETANNWYKYMVGSFTSLDDAITYQKNLKNTDFKDAFVVAYKGAARISLDDAKQQLGMR